MKKDAELSEIGGKRRRLNLIFLVMILKYKTGVKNSHQFFRNLYMGVYNLI